jgi:hypothetical protein
VSSCVFVSLCPVSCALYVTLDTYLDLTYQHHIPPYKLRDVCALCLGLGYITVNVSCVLVFVSCALCLAWFRSRSWSCVLVLV